MKVSFTGTRQGMSAWQKQQLAKFLEEHRSQVALFAHGACSGADLEAHDLVRDVCGSLTFIALKRDRDIVDCGCDLLLAAPLQMSEVLRSGTWSTIRYARKRHVPVQILWRE